MDNHQEEKETLIAQSNLTGGLGLLPCPFCGKMPDLNDEDTLYPSGTLWKYNEDFGMRTYHRMNERQDGDSMCYVMHCTVNAGGCGVEIHGDSKEEVLAAWNRRA
jgi:hypothetical protein